MAWSGSLTASSAVGSKITFTPDTSAEGGYTVSAFTAPKKGIYRFQLYGSGGTNGAKDTNNSGAGGTAVSGGKGGLTDGYLLLNKNQTVFVGAGGTCSAAFVASVSGENLRAIGSSKVYFVAGAGGAGGKSYKTNYANVAGVGGNGGGTSGASGGEAAWGGNSAQGGTGGTQSAAGTGGNAGSYGKGGDSLYSTVQYQPVYAWSGRGGDGYYGGGSGKNIASHNSQTGYMQSHAAGGGGGSGYVKTTSFSHLGKTYTSTTSQGSGKAANTKGEIVVTYYARALLPVFFDGVQLEKIFFNGTDVDSLTYNGTLVYIQKLMRRWKECLNSMAGRSGCLAAIRA